MDIPVCNNCGEILKGKSYRYVITEKHVKDATKYFEDYEDFTDAGNAYKQDIYNQAKRTEERDMCAKCKRIFDYLCKIRRSKLKSLQEAVEKIFAATKPDEKLIKKKRKNKNYCDCPIPIDEGELKTGKPTGICFSCEKEIREE